MAHRRGTAAGGLLLLLSVAGAAVGQQRGPATTGDADTSGRRAASPAQQAVPAKVPPGNVEHGRYLVLPGYTPELAVRLLTQGGVDRDGKRLRPPMPHFHMTVQDAADVVAYLKSLP